METVQALRSSHHKPSRFLAWPLVLLLTACTVSAGRFDPPPAATPNEQAIPPPRSTIPPPPTPDAETLLLVLPTATPYPDGERISIGRSLEGRELVAWQFGQGPVTLVLVGGMHGGYEFNSVLLVEQLAESVRGNPDNLLPGIRLVMVPAANPDGVARGSGPQGRFNANGVDLNRNWGCGWQPTSYWRDETISAGPRPFSEPETAALRAYLLALQPAAVVFYHSAAGAIFVGGCGGESMASEWLGDLLAEATGYPNQAVFEYYEISGTADDWLDERDIPAVTVELADRSDPELTRNLAGVMALQCRFALRGEDVTPQVERQCAGLE